MKSSAILEHARRRRIRIDRCELRSAIELARLALSGEHEEFGFRTPVDWLRITLRMREGAVRDRLCVGEQAPHLAASVAALEAGEIGFGHLIHIAKTRRALLDSVHQTLAFDEEQLLARAREESVGRFFYTCENYRHACDTAGYAEGAIAQHLMRELTIRRRRDGMSTLWGRLDPVAAASLRAALAPLARRLGKDDHRSYKQRLHDAMVERLGASQVARINVTMSIETLAGLKGAPAAEIEGQPPIAQPTADRLSCSPSIRRFVLDGESVVVDAGRSRRVPSTAAGTALDHRDKGCVWPGCERPSSYCNPHHLLHWARGGSTDLENQVLLCYFHHRQVHEGGWQIFRDANGQITTFRPPPTFAAA
ncbi:MAG TPA: DUF222 domain-containing protein [Candidatus Dormibacteraeota bacterium]